MFDEKQCLTMSGTVTKINMNYPHVWLWLSVPTKGGPENWALENTDPASLRVQGWAPGTVKKGARIDVVVSPIRDGRKIAVIRGTRLPDGRVMTSGGPPRCLLPWSGTNKSSGSKP
jgi:hypothetical protein